MFKQTLILSIRKPAVIRPRAYSTLSVLGERFRDEIQPVDPKRIFSQV